MDGVRPVAPVEVALRIDDETRIVAELAARFIHLDPQEAVKRSFAMLDLILETQVGRFEDRMKAEYRRRRGY